MDNAGDMTIRTPETAEVLIEGLTNGIPLRQLCRDNGVSKSAVYDWMDDDEDFAGRMARARVRGGHEIADECMEIADDKSDDHASRKVRIWARLELLSKWNPKQYGAKVALTGDADGDAIKSEMVVKFV